MKLDTKTRNQFPRSTKSKSLVYELIIMVLCNDLSETYIFTSIGRSLKCKVMKMMSEMEPS